jgi:hypothetical protein
LWLWLLVGLVGYYKRAVDSCVSQGCSCSRHFASGSSSAPRCAGRRGWRCFQCTLSPVTYTIVRLLKLPVLRMRQSAAGLQLSRNAQTKLWTASSSGDCQDQFCSFSCFCFRFLFPTPSERTQRRPDALPTVECRRAVHASADVPASACRHCR